MVKKLIALLACFLFALPVSAQNTVPGLGWSQNGSSVSSDQPFLMTSNQPGASQERALDVGTGLTKTDNGANSSFVIGLGPVLSYFYGTGATTNQALLNASHNLAGLASGDIVYYDGANWSLVHKGANSTVFGVNGVGTVGYYAPSGSGTVTSVDLTVPSWLTVTGNPVTGAGTLAVAPTAGLAANSFIGTPDGTTGAVSLRALAAGDIPNHSAAKITSGNLAKAQHATTAVFNDQANTFTGTFTQNFGASTQTLVIPVKASGTTTGEIALNSTDLEFRSAGVTNKAAKQAITISTTSPLSGGGNLSANRTLTLGTVLPTNGGTGQTTCVLGDLFVGSGANTVTKLGIGSTGQKLTVSGGTAAWASGGTGFGGDGSAGAVTKGAVTETTQLQLNSTTFSQTVSTTWAPLSGTIVNATSTCAFNGTTNVGTGCAGGTGGPAAAANGAGLGGGPGTYDTGGGGGGNAGTGGVTASGGGGASYPLSFSGGSGGGGGIGAGNGTGGNGGGALAACSVGAMTMGASATINLDGTAGGAGAGGGSGGDGYFASQTSIANSGTILARGGNGTANGGTGFGGGGGAGGWIWFHSPSNTNGTRTVTGGTGAATGGANGAAGQAVSITGTPNLPLLMGMQEDNFARMKSIALAHRVLNFPAREGFDVELTQREAATACSRGSVIQFAKLVDGNMEESTCIEIGDHVEVLDNAA